MRKTFDIKDEVVLKHLEKQMNQTQYIISLIKKDLKSKEEINREMIIKIIEEYLGERMEPKVDKQVKNSINSILEMIK